MAQAGFFNMAVWRTVERDVSALDEPGLSAFMGSALPDIQLWLGFAQGGTGQKSNNRSGFRAARASGAIRCGIAYAAMDWTKRGCPSCLSAYRRAESNDLRRWHAIA